MDIRIDSSSEVPIRRQLTEQVIFLIATERLRDGDLLPSVRDLARRLKVHHNTVSEAYQDLVRRKWLERRRGSRLTVISRERPPDALTLDDLINRTIAAARENGYSLQQLRERVRQRLLAQPPDHILVVEQDAGLGQLIREELRSSSKWNVECCSRDELASNPGLVIGALAVTPQHALRHVSPLFPKERPVVPVRYSHADGHLKVIRELRKPSIVAVISSSKLFLEVARSILAPAIGNRHVLREVCIKDEGVIGIRAADVVFCDSIARKVIRVPEAMPYPLLSADSVAYVKTAMESYQV